MIIYIYIYVYRRENPLKGHKQAHNAEPSTLPEGPKRREHPNKGELSREGQIQQNMMATTVIKHVLTAFR